MKKKEVLIKVTKSEFSPVVKVFIDVGQYEHEGSNAKEPSEEDIFNNEMPNIRKGCRYNQTAAACDFKCLERKFWDDEC